MAASRQSDLPVNLWTMPHIDTGKRCHRDRTILTSHGWVCSDLITDHHRGTMVPFGTSVRRLLEHIQTVRPNMLLSGQHTDLTIVMHIRKVHRVRARSVHLAATNILPNFVLRIQDRHRMWASHYVSLLRIGLATAAYQWVGIHHHPRKM